MRIVHLLNSSKYSGAENVVITIIKNMPAADSYYVSPKGAIEETLKYHGIQYYGVEKLSIKEIKRMLNELKPDIIHAHDFTASMMAALAAKKRIISHLHNNPPWIQHYGLKSWGFLASTLRYRHILTVSNSIQDEYVFGKIIRKKISMIGNPINKDDIIAKSSLNSNIDNNYDIAFVGRLSVPKDPFLFLEVIKRLKQKKNNIQVCMIGSGELDHQVKQRSRELNLSENIDFLGFLENPYSVLKQSRLLLITSKWEGFGLVAVEALALGKPVVASKVGGLKDIINESCGYLCTECGQMADACLELLENQNLYVQKSTSALERAEKLDNIECYMNTIKQLYDMELISS